MKKDRTEYLGIYVTPEVKKELDAVRNNSELEEQIYRRFIESETQWLEEEIMSIDEIEVKYRAKLIGIKDSFAKVQDTYVEQIEKLISKTDKRNQDLDASLNQLNEKVQAVFDNANELSKRVDNLGYLNINRLESFMDVLDRFDKYSNEQKELMKMLLTKV